jgi:hypothetical protein
MINEAMDGGGTGQQQSVTHGKPLHSQASVHAFLHSFTVPSTNHGNNNSHLITTTEAQHARQENVNAVGKTMNTKITLKYQSCDSISHHGVSS